jgi:hypothetical protein
MPEVQGRVVDLLIYGKEIGDAKASKSPVWVNRKIALCATNTPEVSPILAEMVFISAIG